MTRRIKISIPRLPVAAAPAEDTGGGEVAFGPIGWEWASQGDNGDEAAVFSPPLELLHVRQYNFAVATCPGAVSWRLDPEPGTPPDYALFPLTGAAVLTALTATATATLYATSAAGAELGPITIETVV